jgi:hypothetical protein
VFAAVLTAALLLRGGPRDDVSEYIQDVNEAQRPFTTRYGSVNRVYEQFSLSPETAAQQLPQLRAALRTLTALRVRIERLDAPTEAETLRVRLIAFFRQQETVAKELVSVAAYLPKLRDAEQPLTAVNRRLRTGLRASSTDAQAEAVGAYAVELVRAARALAAIDAPRLLNASHDAYIAQLRSYAAASRALRRAIRDGDQAGVDAAAARLRAASTARPGSERAQRDAILAFNERVSRIQRLAGQVERERRRLDEEVG